MFVPSTTRLSPMQQRHIRENLPDWAADAEMPPFIQWKAAKGMPGVAHGQILAADPQHGSMAIFIYMAPGSVYGEHIHCPRIEGGSVVGVENAIFLSGGVIQDANGTFLMKTSYAAVYDAGADSAWLIHTPKSVGDEPAIFVGVAHGGVIMTNMSSKDPSAVEILERYGLTESFKELLTGIEPGHPKRNPTRHVVVDYVLRTIAAVYNGHETGEGISHSNLQSWFAGLVAESPERRVEIAREQMADFSVRTMAHMDGAALTALASST